MREIINPRWGNNEKTHIIATFRYDDGRNVTALITNEGGANPDWAEIMEKHGVAELDKTSLAHYRKHVEGKTRKDEDRKLHFERVAKEQLFNAKADAFDMEVLRNSKNRKLKNMIRRASTVSQVQIYSTALFILEDPELSVMFKELVVNNEVKSEDTK